MRRLRIVLWAMALVLGGCQSDEDHPIAQDDGPAGSAVVSAANLGKQITVEGWAMDRKIGAEVMGDDFELWIDGLSIWPEGYYMGGDRGKRVRVTGILAEDHGIPVFIQKKGVLPVQGVPVPEGTDLNKASHRYVLKEAQWELVSD